MRLKSDRAIGRHDVWATEIRVKDTVSRRRAFTKLLGIIRRYESLREVEDREEVS